VDDNRVNFKVTGASNQKVILVHGIPSSHREWDALSSELVSTGFSTIALDLLGHGDSFKPDDWKNYNADYSYAFFQEWVKSLQLDRSCVLIGHSFGGHLSMRYALEHPAEVGALVLINPFLSFAQMTLFQRFFLSFPVFVAFVLKTVPLKLIEICVWLANLTWVDKQIRSSLSQSTLVCMVADYKKCSPNIANIPHTVNNHRVDYSEIKIPVFLLWGDRDMTLMTDWYEDVARQIPDCTTCKINADHYPHRTHAEEVNQKIVEFLKTRLFLVKSPG
jgi:pimeloyl-ACP methyl ester carboxylesterase